MQLFVWNDSGTTLPNNMNWTYCAHIRQATFLAERTNVLSILFPQSSHPGCSYLMQECDGDATSKENLDAAIIAGAARLVLLR
jgi:hypothetical protein